MDDVNSTITVVVVTYRGRGFLADCLHSLGAQSMTHDLLVIDNASSDGTSELLRTEFPQVTVLRQPVNRGFAGAVSVALHHVATPRMALLNDDAVADVDWLRELSRTLDSAPHTAAATSRMLLAQPTTTRAGDSTGGLVNNLGIALNAFGYGYDIGLDRPVGEAFTAPTEVFGFSGGAALIDVQALRSAGGSPARFFLYYEDVDMSWRLRLAGFAVVSVPGAVVHHRHSATIGQGSDVFHFHNERNRLLTLLRCAPLRWSLVQTAKFLLTTASLAAKKLLRRPVPPARNFDIGLRVRVLAAVVGSLPRTMAERRAIGRNATVAREQVSRRWLGYDPLV